ncbi:MAG: hypothetical protein DMG69_02725 [Acidobacteria bacterium]|nr:MAG: hypothetical protein DMG69_02725 [Acidobacteriota bacterium]
MPENGTSIFFDTEGVSDNFGSAPWTHQQTRSELSFGTKKQNSYPHWVLALVLGRRQRSWFRLEGAVFAAGEASTDLPTEGCAFRSYFSSPLYY